MGMVVIDWTRGAIYTVVYAKQNPSSPQQLPVCAYFVQPWYAYMTRGLDRLLDRTGTIHLGKRRVGVLEQHLKVCVEPRTSLRRRLEGRRSATCGIVSSSRSIRSAVGLGSVSNPDIRNKLKRMFALTSPPGLTQTKASTSELPVSVVGRGPKPVP